MLNKAELLGKSPKSAYIGKAKKSPVRTQILLQKQQAKYQNNEGNKLSYLNNYGAVIMKKSEIDAREHILNLALCQSRQTVQPLKAAHQSTLYPIMGLEGNKKDKAWRNSNQVGIVESVDLTKIFMQQQQIHNPTEFIKQQVQP